MDYQTMIFWVVIVYVFSRWTPVKVEYYHDVQNANNRDNNETSSGANRGFIVIDGDTL